MTLSACKRYGIGHALRMPPDVIVKVLLLGVGLAVWIAKLSSETAGGFWTRFARYFIAFLVCVGVGFYLFN